jgi:photosystem II stability/assembly factor-like uncharacterized protein
MRKITRINHAAVVLVMLGLAASAASGQTSRWEPANGPYGSISKDIIRTSSGVFLMNDRNNGIWRSTDQCASWQQSTAGMVKLYVEAIALLSDGSVLAGNLNGTYRSSDDGLSWVHSADGLPAGDIEIEDFAELSDGTVFLCSWGKGVFRSTDRGRTWSAANLGLTELRVYCVHRTGDDHLFLGTYGTGVFRSVDHGESWTSSPLAGYIYDIESSPAGVLFASGFNLGVYRSTDDGESWIISDDGVRYQSGYGFAFLSEQVILYAVIDPQGIRQSTDGGVSWRPFGSNTPLGSVQNIVRFPEGDCYATTYGDAVYRLPKDSAVWRPVSNGVQGSWIYALEPVADVGLFAGGYGGVYLSRDAGTSWEYVDRSIGFQCVYDLLFTKNTLYAIGYPGAVRRSTDDGAHWETMNNGISSGRAKCIAAAPDGRMYVGTDAQGMFTSTDDGATWTPCNTGLIPTDIRDVCADAAGNAFAATPGGLYITTDAGAHWTKLGGGLPDAGIHCVHADDGMLYIATYAGLYVSSDHGLSSTRTNEAQINNAVYAVSTDHSGAVYTASVNRCFRSTDHGSTWEVIGAGLPYGTLRDVLADAQGGLYVSTEAHGVYRLAQSAADVEVTVTTAPPGRRLTIDGQVYSNTHTFTWPLGSSHNISTTSPQQGSPGIRYVWISWSNGQPMSHSYTVASGAAVTLTANFTMEYSLTMNAGTGGTVSPGTTWQTAGAQLQILATPNAGYAFDRWLGSGPGSYSGTDNPATITVSSAITETAQFRQVTGTDENAALPRTLVLRQNAPNPCVGNTMFEIGLPHPQSVTLVITDLLGRECARVLDRAQLGAGTHVTAFDAATLPPGVYLYRLDAESGMRAGRMVVMR